MATVNPTLNPRSIQYTDDGNIIATLAGNYAALAAVEESETSPFQYLEITEHM